MRRVVVVCALAGCGDPGAVLAPVIDLPAAGSQADPAPLDEVELSVARAGDAAALVLATFARDEALVLDGVPFEQDLVVHLVGRRSGADIAYGRTCPFDLSEGGAPASPHLWFTRTVRWADAIAPALPDREGAAAWSTADGGIAIVFGEVAGAAVAQIDHFDPVAGTWQTVPTDVTARVGGVLAALGDGRAVLVGGHDEAGQPHTLVEVVDPLAAFAVRVVATEDPRLGVDGTAAATLASGDVIVIGGRDELGPISTVWLLRPDELGALAPRQLGTAVLVAPRSLHTLTRLSADVGAPVVVIGGGDAAGAPVPTAELYRPLDEAFSTTFAATMTTPRSRHAAALMPDGSVLVIGGVDAGGAAVATMERFRLDGGFVAVGELPPGAGLVDAALTPLPDGRLLLSGGRTSVDGAPTRGAYVIGVDPFDGTIDVTATDDLEQARAGHITAALCDGTVLAVGGDDAVKAERYQPPAIGRR